MNETEKPVTDKGAQSSKSQLKRIQGLPISKKLELAKVANREVRAILIKEGNKQVREALLDSARITVKEIIDIAKSSDLGDVLLHKIVMNKEWLKNYQVRLALVNNPKTPISVASKLVPTLRDVDLKLLAKNEDVSEELIVAAEAIIAERVTTESASARLTPPESQVDKTDSKAKSKYQEIKDLPVPEKVKLAMTGDKEARSILIRDSNKQVQEAVLNSPRITEAEIAAVANSRNVSDELLRKITFNREWMKNYQIRLGLVNNPKTPLPVALKIIGTLMISDLKRLSKSKGVSNILVTSAQRALIKKGVK